MTMPSSPSSPPPAPADPAVAPAGAVSVLRDGQPVLEVRDLVKHFPLRGGQLVRHTVGAIHAVCGVSFSLYPGETLGLVGESGCGKSTTGRTILQLHTATSGNVLFEGEDLTLKSRKEMR